MQNKTAESVEKRMYIRHRAKTRVSIRAPGIAAAFYRTINLSAKGVFISTGGLGLSPGARVEITFAIELGDVIKLHKRSGVVIHVYNGGTGFALDDMQLGVRK